MIKIHEKSVLVAIKMETKKTMQKNIEKSWKRSKMDPKMGAQTRSFFGHLAPFFRARRPWEPKWLPSLPQEPPRPVQASISIDFWSIFDDFLMIFCITYFFRYLEVSFSNFWPQVQMCWGRPQGSARWQKSAKTSKASLRKRFSRHGGGTAGGNWDTMRCHTYYYNQRNAIQI